MNTHALTAADLEEACRHLADTTGFSMWGTRLLIAKGHHAAALHLIRAHVRRIADADDRQPHTGRTPDTDGLTPSQLLAAVAALPPRGDA